MTKDEGENGNKVKGKKEKSTWSKIRILKDFRCLQELRSVKIVTLLCTKMATKCKSTTTKNKAMK